MLVCRRVSPDLIYSHYFHFQKLNHKPLGTIDHESYLQMNVERTLSLVSSSDHWTCLNTPRFSRSHLDIQVQRSWSRGVRCHFVADPTVPRKAATSWRCSSCLDYQVAPTTGALFHTNIPRPEEKKKKSH